MIILRPWSLATLYRVQQKFLPLPLTALIRCLSVLLQLIVFQVASLLFSTIICRAWGHNPTPDQGQSSCGQCRTDCLAGSPSRKRKIKSFYLGDRNHVNGILQHKMSQLDVASYLGLYVCSCSSVLKAEVEGCWQRYQPAQFRAPVHHVHLDKNRHEEDDW